jgi:hypothetical protein
LLLLLAASSQPHHARIVHFDSLSIPAAPLVISLPYLVALRRSCLSTIPSQPFGQVVDLCIFAAPARHSRIHAPIHALAAANAANIVNTVNTVNTTHAAARAA